MTNVYYYSVQLKDISSEGPTDKVRAHIATKYLWDGNSERCQCTHHVEVHKTILKDPFTAICYGEYLNSKRPCRCREFIPYRHISEEVQT